jgi:DNA-binding CsgD family transcriptional regulator
VAPRLYDRSEQFAVLHELLAAARRGSTRLAVVSGPAGFGKSELMHAFAAQAVAAGASYLAATASRAEQKVPFGVLTQLFDGSDLPHDPVAELVPPVNDNLSDVLSRDPSSPIAGRTFQRVHRTLLELVEHESATGPLVVGIDDIHYADHASMQCLFTLARRVRAARLLVILTVPGDGQLLDLPFHADIPPSPYSVPVRLPALTPHGTRELLEHELGRVPAQRWASEVHAICGGNPQFARGLVDDIRLAAGGDDAPLTLGAQYSKALLACLHRCDCTGLEVARAIAVLGDAVSERLLGQFLGLDRKSTDRALRDLNQLGLVHGVRFRHQGTGTILLDAMTYEARSEQHRRAADLMIQHNVPAPIVARQLLAAGHTVRRHDIPVLHEAAAHAWSVREARLALDLLETAARNDQDRVLGLKTTAMLAGVEFHVDPGAAARRVPLLTKAVLDDELTGGLVASVGMLQLVLGDSRSAVETLRRVDALPGCDSATGSAAEALRMWLSVVYPESAQATAESGEPQGCCVLNVPGREAVELLKSALTTGPSPEVVEEAKRLLRASKVGVAEMLHLVVALLVVAAADDTVAADRWAKSYQAEADGHPSRIWRAMYAATRAEIALRRGALSEAKRHAEAALTLVPLEQWGIFAGRPLGVLLQVFTLTGSYARAAELTRVSLPAAMFRSPLGMSYLTARGRYFLAINQPAAALEDFLTVGQRVSAWNCDEPALFSWRTDAVRACLRLGRERQARQLATEQLERCAPSGRERAMALWALALCGPVYERLNLLEQSMETLAGCEAPVELAYVLVDQADALRAAGQESKARMLEWRSGQLLDAVGAIAAPTSGAERGDREAPGHAAAPQASTEVLTKAELRVAALAARGMSNRQIARRLFITVSTVEQHLTRAYRKLKVKRRDDLPGDLADDVADADGVSAA